MTWAKILLMLIAILFPIIMWHEASRIAGLPVRYNLLLDCRYNSITKDRGTSYKDIGRYSIDASGIPTDNSKCLIWTSSFPYMLEICLRLWSLVSSASALVDVRHHRPGIQIYMCFHSCYLMKQGPPSEQRKNDFYIAYSVIMMVLSAFAFGSNAFMGQLMWINHRDYPGGPLAYYFAKNSVWFEVFGSTANILQNYMNDALMVSHFKVNLWTAIDDWVWLAVSVLHYLEWEFATYYLASPNVPWFDW